MKKLVFFLSFLCSFAFGQSGLDSLRLVVPVGQDEFFNIERLIISQDNNILISHDNNYKIIVYSTKIGKIIAKINYDSLGVKFENFSLSPSGKFLLGSGSSSKIMAIWDFSNGNLVGIFNGLYGEFIDDNLGIIYQDKSFAIKLISLDSITVKYEERELFKPTKKSILIDLVLDNVQKRVFFYFKDEVSYIYNLNANSISEEINVIGLDTKLNGFEDLKINYSRNGLLHFIQSNRIVEYDIEKKSFNTKLDTATIITSSKTGRFKVIHNDNQEYVYLVDNQTKKRFPIEGQVYGFERISDASFSDDENNLYTASTDGSIYSWSTRSGEHSLTFGNYSKNIVVSKLINNSQNMLYLIEGNSSEGIFRYISIWDIKTGLPIKKILLDSLGLSGDISFAISDNDSLIALTSSKINSIHLIDLIKEKVITTYLEPKKGFDFSRASPRGDLYKLLVFINNSIYFVVGSQLWKASKMKLIQKDLGVFYSFSDDNNYFLSEINDSIFLFETISGKKIKKITAYNYKDLIVSIDGKNARFTKNQSVDTNFIFKHEPFIKILSQDKQICITHDFQKTKVWIKNKVNFCFERFELADNNYLIQLPNSPYYMCSKEASKMLHYVTPSLKVIGFEQLDPVYNRPDIVLDSIGRYFGNNDRGMIEEYRKAWEKRIERLGLKDQMGKLGKGEISVPNAEIQNPESIAYENSEGTVNIVVKANDPKYKLRRFNVWVNEVPLYGSGGISIAGLNKNEWDTTLSVALSLGDNKIQVSVMNELGLENFKYPLYVKYNSDMVVPKTHYIGIGVDKFDNGKNLSFCVKDVKDLGKYFSKLPNSSIKLLTEKEVNKENITKLKEYLKTTSVHDRVIISCSSHGILDSARNFYLATHDTDFESPGKNGISFELLDGLLDEIPARRKLLLLDACNSGENDEGFAKMDNSYIKDTKGANVKIGDEIVKESNFKKMKELFVNVRNNSGAYIISATGGIQKALEGEAVMLDGKPLENGSFTYAVLEYLKENELNTTKLTVNQLKKYVEQRVIELTNGKQTPTSRQETMEIDWDLK